MNEKPMKYLIDDASEIMDNIEAKKLNRLKNKAKI